MLITPRQSPDYCKQVIAWRFFVSRNESSDRLLGRSKTGERTRSLGILPPRTSAGGFP